MAIGSHLPPTATCISLDRPSPRPKTPSPLIPYTHERLDHDLAPQYIYFNNDTTSKRSHRRQGSNQPSPTQIFLPPVAFPCTPFLPCRVVDLSALVHVSHMKQHRACSQCCGTTLPNVMCSSGMDSDRDISLLLHMIHQLTAQTRKSTRDMKTRLCTSVHG